MVERLRVGGVTRGIDRRLGTSMAEFPNTTASAMRSLPNVRNHNFQRYTAAALTARADLESPVAADNPELIGEAARSLFDTVRTMVKASGVSREFGRRPDAQLRDLAGLIT